MKLIRFFNRDGTPWVRPGDNEPLEVGSHMWSSPTIIIPVRGARGYDDIIFVRAYEDGGEIGYVLR